MKVKILFGKDNVVEEYCKIIFGVSICVMDYHLGIVVYKTI